MLPVASVRTWRRLSTCVAAGRTRPLERPQTWTAWLGRTTRARIRAMSTHTQTQRQDSYRLPTNVKPIHYDLTVRTDLEKLVFDGVVRVQLDVLEHTSTVVLHSNKLKLSDITLTCTGSQAERVPSAVAFDTANERSTFTFAQPLLARTKAQLRVAFEGELTPGMVGYYYSISSTASEGQPKHYSLTQFQATDARRAFPCWDEPLLKATYTIKMVSRADTVNLSNMPAASEIVHESGFPDSGSGFDASWISDKLSGASEKWKITRFEKTPPMSTYLVAYANGNFDYLESSYTSPLSGKVRPLRIYTEPASLHQAHFALDVKRQVLPIYERVFDIEYPLPKLDTLVVSDFDAGAMENWGLITGRTTAFLLDTNKANLAAKQNLAATVSHEVAHMWFGNITTMEWWDNLYLNEGFASLIGEITILDKIFPEWKLDQEFISSNLAPALATDAKLSSHPIEVECPDSSAIAQIFDTLSYQKGASVLRMLLNYVGEERFLKGVSIYLKKHLYANSVTGDLWEGIQEATGIDIQGMMDNWVKKVGYPVVTVTETPLGLSVRQDRFLESGPAKPEDNDTIWTIPVSVLSVADDGKAVVENHVLDTRERTIPVDTSKPFKLNADTVGMYRVLYSDECLLKIGAAAASPGSPYSVNDRMGLVYDAMELSRAGYSKVSAALALIEVLCKDEREYLVLDSVAGNLTRIIQSWWDYPNITEPLNMLRRELFAPIVERLGYEYSEDEPVDTRQLRTLAIDQAALSDDERVVGTLRSSFAHYMKTGDDSQIPADLEPITYTIAVKYGGRAEWEAVKNIMLAPKNPSSKRSAIMALGQTQDMVLAEETFAYILDGAREQDIPSWFVGLRNNWKTRRWTVNKFKEHYDQLYKEGGTNFRIAFSWTFKALSSRNDYDETVAFFRDRDLSKFNMFYEQVLEGIATRAAWIERSTVDIQEWLDSRARRVPRR